MAEIIVPELAESITEGTISTWFKQVGDSVEKGENVLELETDKVNVEIVSEEAGVISELKAEEGDTVEVGQVIAIVGEGSGAPAADSAKEEKTEDNKEESKSESVASESADEDASVVVATPSARKLAREKGIDIKDINAADPRGLVRSQDVNKHSTAPAKEETPKEAPKAATKENTTPEKPVRREKMSRRRQTIAKRLLDVSQNTAMLTTFNEIDMTNVMELRKRKKESFMERNDGTKLGFMSFFTKAVTAALRKYPAVNAEIDGTDLIYK